MLKRFYTKKEEKALGELYQKYYELPNHSFGKKEVVETWEAIRAIEDKSDKKAMAYYRKHFNELSDDLVDEFRYVLQLAIDNKVPINTSWANWAIANLTPFTWVLKSHDEKTYEDCLKEIHALYENAKKEHGQEAANPNEEKGAELKTKIGAEANYLLMRQGIATNKLSRVRGHKEDFEFDELLKSGKTIQNVEGDIITVLLANYADNKRLRASTYKLLMALLMEFTETNTKDTTVTLPLKKYMELRGLTNEVAARRQVNEDLEILYSLSLSITYGTTPKNARERKSRRNYMDMRFVIKKGIKNSVISATFAPDFYEALKSYQPMPVAKKILALDDKHLPHAFYFLKFLLEYMNMNYWKANKHVISVASLLASSPEMPTHEEIQDKDRDYKGRIIKPFEDTLNALQNMNLLTWHYVKEPAKNDWDSFIKAKIFFELEKYPKRKRKEITKKTDNKA